jgi:hypothetical protein
MKVLAETGVIILAAFILFTGYLVMLEDRYIYFPDSDVRTTPADIGLDFEDRSFVTPDGVQLHGWYMPERKAHITLLHFHGNAGNISHRLHLYKRWHELGLAVFAFDYRGYGNSSGTPSEQGLYEDAMTAWRELTETLKIPGNQIILAGRSIGCAVAVQLATEVHAKTLVLETPFTSIADMARTHYPFLPMRFLLRTRFDALAGISHVRVPVLIISARDDAIAPAWMGRKLFEAANEPKQWRLLAGDHNNFDQVSERDYLKTWKSYLQIISGRNSS